MINLTPPSAVDGPLLLVDISGYTSFLQSVAQAHANDMFTNTAVPEARLPVARRLMRLPSAARVASMA